MTSPSLSHLQLSGHAFTEVSVRAIPDGNPSNEPRLETEVSYEADPRNVRRWGLALRVVVTSANPAKPFSYDLTVGVQGVVEVDELVPAPKREDFAAVNGLSLLYGAAREMVLNLTSRSVAGAVSLPSLNFVEILGEARTDKHGRATAKSGARRK